MGEHCYSVTGTCSISSIMFYPQMATVEQFLLAFLSVTLSEVSLITTFCINTPTLHKHSHLWCMHLADAGWLACSNDPKSYAGRSLMLLAGPTKPDRSLGEGPDEACIPVLQARGFGSGLTTRNCNK